MQEKMAMVLDAMKAAGKPVKAGEVADATGLAKAEVSKAIDALKKEGRVISPKVCYYAPADV